MNVFVEQYKRLIDRKHDSLTAFGAVASTIAVTGTIDDLKKVDDVFRKQSQKEWEELINERTTTAI